MPVLVIECCGVSGSGLPGCPLKGQKINKVGLKSTIFY